MALAAQAYAKSELLWYFRHVAEKLPAHPAAAGGSRLTAPLLGQQQKPLQLPQDGHVVQLVAAASGLYDLLVSGWWKFPSESAECRRPAASQHP